MRKILYLQYTNPAAYPPLEHSSRILARLHWKVLFLGTGSFGEANGLQFPFCDNVTVRQLSFCRSGPFQKLHYLWFSLWVLGWTLYWRPRWIYASDLFTCPVALMLSFLPGVKLVYHEHDSPDQPEASLFFQLCLYARKKLSRRTTICIFPNQKRADYFSKAVANGREISQVCVWNCPRRDEVGPPREPRPADELWIYYHGVIGPLFLPRALLQAMASLPAGVKLLVAGYETAGCLGYVRELRQEADRLGLGSRVQFLGAMSRYEILRHCRRCDVGFALMPKKDLHINDKHKLGASNKPFDYLACGLALLVSDLPDWRQMYAESGYGLACNPDDAGSIASALLWFFEHPVEMRAMGEMGRQRILKDWNYELQFEPVAEIFNNLGRNE